MCVSNAQQHSLTLAGRLLFNLKTKLLLMHDIKPHLSSLTTNFEVNKKKETLNMISIS